LILLDENITAAAEEQLRRWRISVRVIAGHLTHKGAKDSDLLPILHRLAQPTFFTHDRDFWTSSLCHPRYCIVHLAVEDTEAVELHSPLSPAPAIQDSGKEAWQNNPDSPDRSGSDWLAPSRFRERRLVNWRDAPSAHSWGYNGKA
jgi:hypothetical protein